MAKIIIELNTAAGDNLDDVFGEFGFFRRDNPEVLRDEQDKFDPNAYKPTPQAEEAWDKYKKEDGAALKDAQKTVNLQSVVNSKPDQTVVHNGMTIMQQIPLTEMDGDRKRGEAGPGHRRRTNAQIEEDKIYFAQVEAAKAEAARAATGVAPATFKTFDDGNHALATMDAGVEAHPDAAISTGGERVNPEDAADEEAETAQREPGAEPTLEDLRAAYACYAAKFGAPAAIKDVRAILGCGVSATPPDKIAEGIAKIDAAIAAENIDAHLAETTVDTIQTVSPQIATQADVVEAMKAYGRKFDGSDDPEKMVFTKEDLPKVFGATFGPKVTGLGSLPDKSPETFGTLLAAITAATEGNTFKREARS